MNAIELIAARAQLARAVGHFSSEPVPSPCVSVCRMDTGTGLCEGCFRTLDEIAAWGTLDNAGKREVWELIAQRAGA